ncbi:NmrA family NAD(P)-binding protein [Actinomadura opuntiae]|uniref:NmrA family NAD(P)-binding protein n=1 Tax=Actinomadura sp. OS1-43 TaxID=604315 RepID=UPI00255ABDDF|nr:NmrA family NAD(P)-binding protein [Actinomadura sp. OS1-43]MDL4817340.1 NmrA family NAD(P)-binding protein [Actinomadura sp. OS1-43]
MKALIVGAGGYNGGNVARLLAARGHTVRGLVRDSARAASALKEAGIDDVVQGDAITGAGLHQALTGVDTAFYFVHALDAPDRRTDERDLRAARQFVRAAQTAGLRQGVFFTTLAPPRGARPPIYQHNRLRVEEILLDGIPGMSAVRAGMVLGARSRGLLPYVKLVQRAPIVPLGPWCANRIAVIDPATVTEAIVAAGTDAALAGRSLDAPVCAQPTHQELVRAIATTLGLRRLIVRSPIATPRLDAALIAAVTGEPYGFCRYLSSGNEHDYVIDPARSEPFGGLNPPSLREALRHALRGPRPHPVREPNRGPGGRR